VVATRLAAVVGAVAMIAAGLWWRGRDDADAPATPRGPVVCATELRAACDELATAGRAVVVEAAGTTAERLAAEDGRLTTTWITLTPWPGIVDARRRVAGREPRYATPSAAAVVATRAVVGYGRVAPCAASPTWRCVGAQEGLALDDPLVSAAGPGELTALAGGVVDLATTSTSEAALATAMARWRATRLPNAAISAVDNLLTFPGSVAVAVGTDGAQAPMTVPTPAAAVGVVVAGPGAGDARIRTAAARLGAAAVPAASVALDGEVAYGLQLAWPRG
jgi:hypothetical protein